jgi:hypothetical protein
MAQLLQNYEEPADGFVIARFVEWDAHHCWPCVELTYALWQLPREHQMFVHLAVSHGLGVKFDAPRPLALPEDMFPFEQQELTESDAASRTAIDTNDDGRLDMRDCAVFTIDAAVTVDLDDAMHCHKQDDGCFQVCAASPTLSHMQWTCSLSCLQVGIHIADVSRFVAKGSHLDACASCRHATQYLLVPSSFGKPAQSLTDVEAASVAVENLSLGAVGSRSSAAAAAESIARASDDVPQRVARIPMLPPDVSRACSLNPGEDRYAVTVIFVVDAEVRDPFLCIILQRCNFLSSCL